MMNYYKVSVVSNFACNDRKEMSPFVFATD